MAFLISLRSSAVNSISTAPIVLIQTFKLARAGNGRDPGFLRQQPGQGDLRWGGLVLGTDPFQQIDHRPVGLDRLLGKAGIAARMSLSAKIVFSSTLPVR